METRKSSRSLLPPPRAPAPPASAAGDPDVDGVEGAEVGRLRSLLHLAPLAVSVLTRQGLLPLSAGVSHGREGAGQPPSAAGPPVTPSADTPRNPPPQASCAHHLVKGRMAPVPRSSESPAPAAS